MLLARGHFLLMSQSERRVVRLTQSIEEMMGVWLLGTGLLFNLGNDGTIREEGVTVNEWKPVTMVESLLPCFAPLTAISCRWALTYPSPET